MNNTQYLETLTALEEASLAYYGSGNVLMSDAEFDVAVRACRAYEEENDLPASAVTGTVGAGYKPTGTTVKHQEPMLSLGNTFDHASTVEWANRRSAEIDASDVLFSAEPKVDGSAVSVRYLNGKPTVLATRGDGEVGEDVTDALFQVQLPTFDEGDFTVRGEIVFTKEQYADATAKRIATGKDEYVNPRNAVAGILGTQAQHRQFDVELSMICYDALGIEGDDAVEVSEKLESMGFLTTLGLGSHGHTVNDIAEAVADLEQRRYSYPFELDGVVIKMQDFDLRDQLGVNSKDVRWGISYKFPAKIYYSTIEEVEISIGKTGRATYRSRIAPVKLDDGVTVERASIHNLDFIKKHNIRIGSTCELQRMGDVIPRVSNCVGGDVDWVPPTECPQCGETWTWEPGDLFQVCKTPACSVQGTLEYACSSDALDCEGISSGTITKILEKHDWIADLADFMSLTREQIGEVEGYEIKGGGPKGKATGRKGDIVYEAMQIARTRPLERLIISFILPFTGRSMSKRLAQHFGSLDALRNATVDEIEAVDKMGPIKSQGTFDKLIELSPMIDRLVEMGFQTEMEEDEAIEVTNSDNPLNGKVCYVTGKLPISKKEAQLVVEKCGGTFKQSSETSVIIGSASAKVDKFVSKGATHMDVETFMTLAESL